LKTKRRRRWEEEWEEEEEEEEEEEIKHVPPYYTPLTPGQMGGREGRQGGCTVLALL
jgi:hypothetical protein